MKNKLLLFLLLVILINYNSNAQCGGGTRNMAKDAFILTNLDGIQDVATSPNGKYTAFVGIGSNVSSYGNPSGTNTGGVPTYGNIVHILDSNYNYVSNTSVVTTRKFPFLNGNNGPNNSQYGAGVWRIKYLPNGGLMVMCFGANQLAYLAPGAASWVLSPTSGTGGYTLALVNTACTDPIQIIGGDTVLCVNSAKELIYYVGSQNRFYEFNTTVTNVLNGSAMAYCYLNGNAYFQSSNTAPLSARRITKVSFPGGIINPSFNFYFNVSQNLTLMALCPRPTDGLIFAVGNPNTTLEYQSQKLYSGSQVQLYTSTYDTVKGDFLHTFVFDQNGNQAVNQVDQRYLNLLYPMLNKSYFKFDAAGNIYFNNETNQNGLSTIMKIPTTLVKLFSNGVLDANFMINQTDFTDNLVNNIRFNGFSIYPNDGRIVSTGADYNLILYDKPCGRTNATNHLTINGYYYITGSSTAPSRNSGTSIGNTNSEPYANLSRGMMLFNSQGKMDCSGSAGSGCPTVSITCNSLTLSPAPTSGTAAAGLVLSATVNVSGLTGNYPIKVSGPGFTSAQNYIAINSLGSQTINIPVNYDGTAFTSANNISFTISSPSGTGSTTCSLGLLSPVNTIVPIIKSGANCLPTIGPIMK